MNRQEIFTTLKNKGFTVAEMEDGVVAELNRNMDTIEIMMALDYQIEDHQLVKLAANAIGILCLEEELS